jgi:hypothetical protein
MSQPPYGPPPGYGPPPPVPPQRPKRFSGALVAVGVLVGMVVAVGLPLLLLAGIAGVGPDQAWVGWAFLGLGVLLPAAVGAVLVFRGSPERRGFGLGLLLGWAGTTLVGGGICAAIILSLSAGSAG